MKTLIAQFVISHRAKCTSSIAVWHACFINLASNEQEAGANQINMEVMRLNSLSQQNAAISQQTEANSSELMLQAKKLNEVIAFFKSE